MCSDIGSVDKKIATVYYSLFFRRSSGGVPKDLFFYHNSFISKFRIFYTGCKCVNLYSESSYYSRHASAV